MSELPQLTTADVQEYFYETYFDRGLKYFRQGRIMNPRREGMVLKADCQGSRGAPYQVEATLELYGIEATACSCPIGFDCKHAVALLLSWVMHPEDFEERASMDVSLRERLEACTKEQLIALVVDLAARQPSAANLLYLLLERSGDEDQPLDLGVITDQLADIFSQSEWKEVDDTMQALAPIVETARTLYQSEQPQKAASIYRLILKEALPVYQDIDDYNFELGAQLNDVVNDLSGCWQELPAEHEEREIIMGSLFGFIRWNRNLGGYGFGERLPKVLLAHATPDELRELRQWIQQEVKRASGQGNDFSREWNMSFWGAWLAEVETELGESEAYLSYARAQGMYKPLFDKLLEMDRIGEAVEVARDHLQATEGKFFHAIQALEKAGYVDEAFGLVLPMQKQLDRGRLLDWLMGQHEQREEWPQALALAQRSWDALPQFDTYQTLERLSRRLSDEGWQRLKVELQSQLKQQQQVEVLVQVYLWEKEWDKAWELVEPTSPQQRRLSSYEEEKVAEATRAHRPERVMRWLMGRAEQLVAQRGRGNYAAAASLLKDALSLAKGIGMESTCRRAIRRLQDENPTLRALKDEWQKAGFGK